MSGWSLHMFLEEIKSFYPLLTFSNVDMIRMGIMMLLYTSQYFLACLSIKRPTNQQVCSSAAPVLLGFSINKVYATASYP